MKLDTWSKRTQTNPILFAFYPPLLGGIAGVSADKSLKFVAAGVCGERFGFGARIFSAIQRTNSINYTVRPAIGGSFQEGTNIRQFATGAAMQAPAFAVFGNRQNGSKSSFDFVNHGSSP